MRGVGGPLPAATVVRIQVATCVSAVRRRNRQRVVVADVAVRAAHDFTRRGQLVRIRKREAGVAMVESRVCPHDGVVAGRAERRREASRNVIWHGPTEGRRAVPGGLMATVAVRVRGGEGIVVTHVAIGAGHDFPGRRHLVGTRQWPACRTVIKDCRSPRDGVMAGRAVRRRESCSSR
jgi:hypothetical protein